MSVRRAVVVAVLLAAVPPSVLGHELSRSESRLEVRDRDIHATITVDLVSFGQVDVNRDDIVTYDELDPEIERIYASLKSHFFVGGPEPPVSTRVERYQIVSPHLLRMEVRYAFDQPPQRVAVTSRLDKVLGPDHRHLITVRFAGDLQQAVLGAGAETALFDAAAGRSSLRTLRTFVTLGIEHIITGYDHLAFLVCLLMAATTFRSLVGAITAFTLAHSITLGLATFDVVSLPTRLTESLIALSIAYVAVENLLDVRTVARSRITFLFGLIHGFGFSTILRDMQLPRMNLALSLFSFNAGVEIGQIAFIVVAFPLVRSAAARWRQQFGPAVSAGVVVLAAYWFFQRALLG
jgi:hypothetical protein